MLNTPAEWHALVIGVGEVLCPLPPRIELDRGPRWCSLQEEYHYYQAGRGVGMLFWVGVVFCVLAMVI